MHVCTHVCVQGWPDPDSPVPTQSGRHDFDNFYRCPYARDDLCHHVRNGVHSR